VENAGGSASSKERYVRHGQKSGADRGFYEGILSIRGERENHSRKERKESGNPG